LEALHPSLIQQQLLLHTLISPEDSAYICYVRIDLPMATNTSALYQACCYLAESYPFYLKKGASDQIEEAAWSKFSLSDFKNVVTVVEDNNVIPHIIDYQHALRFSIYEEPLIRFTIVKDQERCCLLCTYHHALMDGKSYYLYIQTLFRCYEDIETGLGPFGVDLKPFVNDITPKSSIEEKSYWKKLFKNHAAWAQLPTNEHSKEPPKKNSQNYQFNERLYDAVKVYAKLNKVTVYTVLHLALAVLIAKFGNNKNVVIGTVRAWRDKKHMNSLGLHINTLPIRIDFNKLGKISCALEAIKEQQQALKQYNQTSLHKIQEWVNCDGADSLFDIVLDYKPQTLDAQLKAADESWLSRNFSFEFTSHYSLMVEIFGHGDRLYCRFNCNNGNVIQGMIPLLFNGYQNILYGLLNGGQHVKDLSLYSNPSEAANHIIAASITECESDFSIIKRFDLAVINSLKQVAISFREQSITYEQLSHKVNQFANHLLSRGVAPHSVIAIDFNRSIEMVICILAILKASCCYLPLSSAWPDSRKKSILTENKVSLIITNHNRFVSDNGRMYVLNYKDIALNQYNSISTHGFDHSNNLMYIMYTSGSTGKPKGIQISHNSVANVLQYFTRLTKFSNQNKILSITDYTFDISVLEIFMPLINGGQLVICDKNTLSNPTLLCEMIKNKRITHMQATPTVWQHHIDQLIKNHVEIKVLSGGEPLNALLASKLKQLGSAWNCYGPTETTIWSSVYCLNSQDNLINRVPAGHPISNTVIAILDVFNKPLPFGAHGEIAIGGVGVSPGYVEVKLNKGVFLDTALGYGVTYKTGDIGCITDKKFLFCLGRNDNQIKLHGHRFELEEVESTALRFPSILQAVVILDKCENKCELILCYVSKKFIDKQKFLRYLRENLPSYAVPNHIFPMQAIPLLTSGKVDRPAILTKFKSVCSQDIAADQNQYVQPLIDIWSNYLKDEINPSPNESFFRMGGHSLIAMQIIIDIQKIFNMQISLAEFFSHPTIIQLSVLLESKYGSQNRLSHRMKLGETTAVVPLQNTIWSTCEGPSGANIYTIPIIFKIEGPVDPSLLVDCILHVVHQTPEFNQLYYKNGSTLEKIYYQHSICCEFKSHADVNIDNKSQFDAEWARHRFDMKKGPYIRVSLIEWQKNIYFFYINVHHLIVDNWSIHILLQHISQIYNTGSLIEVSKLPLDLNASFNSNYLHSKNYWQSYLKNANGYLHFSHIKKFHINYEGESLYAHIDNEICMRYEQDSFLQDVPLVNILLACYYIVLWRYTNQTDILVGMPVTLRDSLGVHNQVGLFVNTVILRSKLNINLSVSELIQICTNDIRSALLNSDLPISEISQFHSGEEREASAMPFDAMIIFDHSLIPSFNLHGLKIDQVKVDYPYAKTKISLYIEKYKNINIRWEYQIDAISPTLMQSINKSFMLIARSIVECTNKPIKAVPYLSSDETEKLLTYSHGLQKKIPEETIYQLFEKSVEVFPNKVALIFATKGLTYLQLSGLVSVAASNLSAYSPGDKEIIPIYYKRSIEMIVSILAILKIGCSFLPLNVDSPDAYLQSILDCVSPNVIIGESNHRDLWQKDHIQYLVYDADHPLPPPMNITTKTNYDPSDTAYVLFTSGSTGAPKGVCINHKGLVNRLLWMQDSLGIEPKDVFIQKTPISFDVSMWECFLPLICGAHLVIAPEYGHKNPKVMFALIKKYSVTIVHFIPKLLQQFYQNVDVKKIPKLNHIILSGEALPVSIAAEYYALGGAGTIYNYYGPTEATIDVTAYKVELSALLPHRSTVPIGKPINNVNSYVLNDNLDLSPTNVLGELYISGVALSSGYLNNEPLTQQYFIHHPKFGRLYKTGDYVAWLDTGDLIFIDRADQQVKINGIRVELSSLSFWLNKLEGVEASIFILLDNLLFALYTTHNKNEISEESIKSWLLKYVHASLLPSNIIYLSRMPHLVSGKISIPAIKNIVKQHLSKISIEKPANNIELLLCNIWSVVLSIDAQIISTEASFFSLGGNSINVISLLAQLCEQQIFLTASDIYENPTIKRMSKICRNEQPINDELEQPFALVSITIREQFTSYEDVFPASSLQAGMLYHSMMDYDPAIYLDIFIYTIHEDFNKEKFELCWQLLCRQYQALRTGFHIDQEYIFQLVSYYSEDLLLFEHNAIGNCFNQEYINQWISHESQRPFAMDSHSLARLTTFYSENKVFKFAISFHHAILDGYSLSLLINEFIFLYTKPTQIDQTHSTNKQVLSNANYIRLESDAQENYNDKTYWMKQIQEFRATNIYSWYVKQSGLVSYKVDRILDSYLTRKLHEIATNHHLTTDCVLLGVLVKVLSILSASPNVGLGIITNGRPERLGGDTMMGLFLNTLPFSVNIKNDSFLDIFNKILAKKTSMYAHRRYPLAKILQDNQMIDPINIIFNYFKFEKYALLDDLQDIIVHEYINYPIIFNCGLSNDNRVIIRINSHEKYYARVQINSIIDLWSDFLSVALENVHEVQHASIPKPLEIPPLEFSSKESAKENDLDLLTIIRNNCKLYGHKKLIHDSCGSYKLSDLYTFSLKIESYFNTVYQDYQNRAIAVCLEPNFYAIASILGILSANMIYVPIDMSSPEERVRLILDDSQSLILLVDDSTEKLYPNLCTLNIAEVFNTNVSDDFQKALLSKDGITSIIIYTSGSTGCPKGVKLSLSAIMQTMQWLQSFCSMHTDVSVLMRTSLSFDISLTEIFLPLINATNLYIASSADRNHPNNLVALLNNNKIQLLQVAPSMLELLLDCGLNDLPYLQYVLVAGEVFPVSLINKYQLGLGSIAYINLYGPTECTIYTTGWRCKPIDAIHTPIGFVSDGRVIQVLNHRGNEVPLSVPGELYVSGVAVANGYVSPQIKKNGFISSIQNGFNANDIKMYKTGDIVYKTIDEGLVYLLRKDHQVKINGIRVELDELELTLNRNACIRNSVILHRKSPYQHLVAFYTLSNATLTYVNDEMQVRKYQYIWDDLYQAEDVNLFSEWNNSYNNDPIPIDEMMLWLNLTLDHIKSFKPVKVLEVGCGKGTLIPGIEDCKASYTGIDFSESVINRLNHKYINTGHEFHVMESGDIDKLTAIGTYDLIVINSVVQYFPSTDYLKKVLNQIINTMDNGYVFIGDVRDARLFFEYQCWIYHKKNQSLSQNDRQLLDNLINVGIITSTELLISPGFFIEFIKMHDKISNILMLPKYTSINNEIFNFRYDVILEVQTNIEDKLTPLWVTIGKKSDLDHLLSDQMDYIGIREYPRINLYDTDSKYHENSILSIEEIIQLANQYNYSVLLSLSLSYKLCMNILFYKNIYTPSHFNLFDKSYVNTNHLPRSIEPFHQTMHYHEDIYSYLSKYLPKSVIPTKMIEINNIPINSSGKRDRALLNQYLDFLMKDTIKVHNAAPTTTVEKKVFKIWQDVLKLNEFDINSTLYQLGMHSLNAIQLTFRLENEFSCKIKISEVLQYPNVKLFSQHLELRIGAIDVQPLSQITACNQKWSPLTNQQNQVWFLYKLYQRNLPEYYIILPYLCHGIIDTAKLKSAIQCLIDDIPILTANIIEDDDGSARMILRKGIIEQYYTLLPAIDSKDCSNAVKSIYERHVALETDQLFKVFLYPIKHKQESLLIIFLHHIIGDQWSINKVIQLLAKHYGESEHAALGSINISYFDYAFWQKEEFYKNKVNDDNAFWINRLKGFEILQVASDKRCRNHELNIKNSVSFSIPSELLRKMQLKSQVQNITLQMVFLAAFNLLLSRYSNQKDILIGYPVANRDNTSLADVVGMFVNVVPIRSNLRNETANGYLHQIKNLCLEALDHQSYDLREVLSKINIHRRIDKHPLFNHLFVYNYIESSDNLMLGQLECEAYPVEYQSVKFDLSLHINENSSHEVDAKIIFNNENQHEELIHSMINHYKYILDYLCGSENRPLRQLSFLSLKEHNYLLTIGTGQLQTLKNDCLLDLIDNTFKCYADKIALKYNNKSLTYLELDKLTRKLSIAIYKANYSPNPVAILATRSLEMMIAIIAVLRSGRAYAPIACDNPVSRNDQILEDLRPGLLLYNQEMSAQKKQLKFKGICLNIESALQNNQNDDIYATYQTSNKEVYILFTSGSTGKPKGVKISQSSITNLLMWMKRQFSITAESVIINKTPYTFDVSVWEMLLPMVTGAKLILPNQDEHKDMAKLYKLVKNNRVSIVHFVPTMIRLFVEYIEASRLGQHNLSHLCHILCGGDILTPALVKSIYSIFPNKNLYNCYGPTETTIDATFYAVNGVKNLLTVPIGRPIDNVEVYVLGDELELLPRGVPGELYIAGMGLSTGYVDLVLNNTSFISKDDIPANIPATKLYKTGDIVQWDSDGQLNYLGRKDNQFKNLGVRIETSEIEKIASACSFINYAKVIVDKSSCKPVIMLFYQMTSVTEHTYQIDDLLHAYFYEHLPQSMRPTLLIPVDSMPLNIHGKLDAKALLDQYICSNRTDTTLSLTQREKILVTIWQQVLDQKNFHPSDNFFACGGDSISVLSLVRAFRNSGIPVTPSDIFKYPTIALQAKYALDKPTKKYELKNIDCKKVPLSPIQLRFLQKRNINPNFWNQGIVLSIPCFEVDLIQSAINQVFSNHEIFKYAFLSDSDSAEVLQDHQQLPLIVIENHSNIRIEDCFKRYQAMLNIAEGKTILFILMKNSSTDYQLYIIANHLVIDGVSWGILTDNLNRALQKNTLTKELVTLKQWTYILKQYLHRIDKPKHVMYWLNILDSIQKAKLNNNSNRDRPILMKNIESISLQINQRKMGGGIANKFSSSIHTMLLTCFTEAYQAVFKGEKLALYLDSHGRQLPETMDHYDLSQTIGWLTAIYPMLLDLSGHQSFEDKLNHVEELIAAIPDGGLSYSVLSYYYPDKSITQRLQNNMPLVGFNYLGRWRASNDHQMKCSIDIKQTIADENHFPSALYVTFLLQDDELNVQLLYDINRYSKSITDQLLQLLQELISKYLFGNPHLK
jgi:amino acid adenylation domain-containing protein/non-ribosomal peptide synthase protein (TIGR01720 family)